MLAANRHVEIMKIINRDRFVKVSQLSALFDVSEETIRRDLDKLEKEGLLRKLHGGAVPVDVTNVDNIKPIVERIQENIDAKKVIARLAYELIEDGDSLILDSGSTTLQLAKILDDKKVTVITNDISIAYELSLKDNVNLIVTGGNRSQKSFSITGPECERYLKSFNVNKLFLSTSGIKLKHGLTASNQMDAFLKRMMIDAADRVICLADNSKFGKVALITFASFSDIDLLVTDKALDNSYEKAFSDFGTKVIVQDDDSIIEKETT